jgi:hypothetical protein
MKRHKLRRLIISAKKLTFSANRADPAWLEALSASIFRGDALIPA